MRRLSLILLVLCVAVSSHAADSAAGRWTGSIARPDGPLELQVELWQTDEGRWRGHLTIPAQGAKDLPMEVDVAGTQVMFRVLNIPGEPPFLGTFEGDVIDGEFKAAQPYALTLMRVVDEAPSK
jgi:hypothetical protein